EVARSERHQHPFTLALLDVDGFRAVNDKHGHNIGDRVLRDVADLLRTRSRKSDTPFRVTEQLVAARYGGGVVALILTETERASAAAKLNSLRQAVKAHTFGIPGSEPLAVTAGFACYPEDGRDREALLDAASAALRAGKREGGDTLISYTPALGTQDH